MRDLSKKFVKIIASCDTSWGPGLPRLTSVLYFGGMNCNIKKSFSNVISTSGTEMYLNEKTENLCQMTREELLCACTVVPIVLYSILCYMYIVLQEKKVKKTQ